MSHVGTIYTASSPGYDRKPLTSHNEPGVKLDARKQPDGEPGRLWNRKQKLLLPPEDGVWSVYLDGSLSPKGPVRERVEKWLAAADMAFFKHPWRTCAYAEIDECVLRKKITAEEAEKTRSMLQLAGFPRDFGLWACGMIARRSVNNELQKHLAPIWWDLTSQMQRDQIWLPFVLWRFRNSVKRVHTIDKDIYNNSMLSFRRHGA